MSQSITVKYLKRSDAYYVLDKNNSIKEINQEEFQLLQSIVATETNEYIEQELTSLLNNKPLIATINFNNGIYEGAVVNNTPHGNGVLTTDEYKYNGEFKNGLFDGYGILDHTYGFTYKGYYRKGRKHGDGVLQYTNGSLERGCYKLGTVYYPNISVYKGTWENNKFTGFGVSYLRNDVKSESQYVNNKKNGAGTLEKGKTKVFVVWDMDTLTQPVVYESGDKYYGSFDLYDLRIKNGVGKMEYDNGDVYEGNWWDEKKCFDGLMKYANGDVYAGKWKEDKRHGQGTLIKTGGISHIGEFHQDKFIVYQEV